MISEKKNRLFNRQYAIVLVFVAVTLLASFIPYFKLDLLISGKVQAVGSTFFQDVMQLVSSIGNKPIMIIIVGVVSLFLYLNKLHREAVISSLSAAGSALFGSLVKILVDRPRPTAELVNVSTWWSDKSYPSNHVLVFTVYFGFLLYLLLKKPQHKIKGVVLSTIFIILISSIGVSRIYLGVHWASDVLGGYLLGILWLILTIKLYNSNHGKR